MTSIRVRLTHQLDIDGMVFPAGTELSIQITSLTVVKPFISEVPEPIRAERSNVSALEQTKPADAPDLLPPPDKDNRIEYTRGPQEMVLVSEPEIELTSRRALREARAREAGKQPISSAVSNYAENTDAPRIEWMDQHVTPAGPVAPDLDEQTGGLTGVLHRAAVRLGRPSAKPPGTRRLGGLEDTDLS